MRLELGRVLGNAPGPTLVLIGGMHGNEPAGVEAARRVIERVAGDAALRAALLGELVALQGNPPALAAGRRYLGRDLNRQWTAPRLAAARAALAAADEDAELAALVVLEAELEAILARARGPVFVLDLHTTSAAGMPFVIVGASPADRAFATQLGLPGIVGMQETLPGVLTAYLAQRGCIALAIEGGQNQSPTALTHLEAAVTVALCAAGILAPSQLPELGAAQQHLTRTRGELPQLTEVALRHEVHAGSGFRMEPGFATIQRVSAGTLLAREQGRELRAPFDGVLLLPLYQAQGSDGFFYGRELTPRTS